MTPYRRVPAAAPQRRPATPPRLEIPQGFGTFALLSRMNFLTVTDLRKAEGSLPVVKGVSFVQQEHQRLAIVGESGSGKSTLLKMIAGYAQPDGGQVRFLDKRVLGPDEQLIMGHPGIAYLSQHFELRNNYRVEELLAMANQMTDEEAHRIFEVCRIVPFLKRKTHQVSGGEKQRIALARLLVGAPRLLLLDEPYSNLDLIHKTVLKTVVQEIGERLGLTVLLVSHDPLDTLPWADHILVMRAGEIVQTGTPAEVYRRPMDEYVGGLFGAYNLVPEPDGRRRFLRPADLQMDIRGIAGTVTRVAYLGDSFDVTVSTGTGPLTINTRKGGVAAGDKVHLAPVTDAAWYL